MSQPSQDTSNGVTAVLRLHPVSLEGIDPQLSRRFLRQMLLIRAFEEAAEGLLQRGAFPGGMHSSVGQEATAVGVLEALEPSDIVTATHRSHHITLAKGLTARAVMAELYGKETGCVGGRGGHMHLADVTRGHFGANAIVGSGLGIALGAALAASVREVPQVAAGFFGDGGANVGRVWEYVNLAALWQLPLVIVCENNLYAVETALKDATAGGDISKRARGFGLPVVTVDGQNVTEVYRAAKTAATAARSGHGPTFIECLTYRYGGHDVGDLVTYRTTDEVGQWRSSRDPIERLMHAMLKRGDVDDEALAVIARDVEEEVADSVEFAEKSPYPDESTFMDGVTALDLQIRGNL